MLFGVFTLILAGLIRSRPSLRRIDLTRCGGCGARRLRFHLGPLRPPVERQHLALVLEAAVLVRSLCQNEVNDLTAGGGGDGVSQSQPVAAMLSRP